MDQLSDKKLGLIGGGHITEIILDNLIGNHAISAEQVIVSNRSNKRLIYLKSKFGVETTPDNQIAIQQSDLIFVNVPPSNVHAVILDLAGADLRLDQIVISIAAGIPLRDYGPIGSHQPLVRALPNPELHCKA